MSIFRSNAVISSLFSPSPLALRRIRHDLLSLWSLLWALLLLCPTPSGAEVVEIGVLSHRGDDLTLAHWQPTADYLTTAVAGFEFEIIPLHFSRINEAVELEFVDFLLVNPGIYVVLEVSHGISRLATLNNRVGDQNLNQFGSAIITRSDRDDINTLEDLRRKRFLAVDERSLGGFQMAWGELLEAGIDPYRHFSQLEFSGNHDSVVLAVAAGEADAGTVRTNILERMAAELAIDLQQFKVIHPIGEGNFPFVRSTRLFPEWPLSKLKHTPSALAQQVAVALLNMPAQHPAAEAGNYGGWTVPLDYQPVHELFQQLRLPPYHHNDFTLSDVIQRYWLWLVACSILLLLFLLLLYWIWLLNRQLYRAKSSLEAQHLLILNSVADGIYGVDCNGNSTFVNRAMEEMTGWKSEEMVGFNQHEMLHHTRIDGSPFPVTECPVYATCHDGEERYIRQDLFWRKDGTSFPVEYACSSVRNDSGEVVGSVVVFRDIGEKRRIEAAERQHQRELAHIGRLNTMGEMVAGIAHEINQPLTAITSSAQASIRLLDA
ncbi:MAG: PhnD/SsuA/transferrin family substrate-binding protein, partial [Gammaproteobacteria bacterium]|nr:PhnD/SsuA/transferrin family substrate-binding protein [Gammaproteobacteria bacterium]